jgi:hypothetical protein
MRNVSQLEPTLLSLFSFAFLLILFSAFLSRKGTSLNAKVGIVIMVVVIREEINAVNLSVTQCAYVVVSILTI